MAQPDTYTEVIWDIMKEVGYNDPNFEFLASLLSYGLAKDGFYKKQIKYIEKFKDKYSYIWEENDNAVHPYLTVIDGGDNAIN
jgi:hypothetical protein